MNASASAIARIAGIALVLILAAILGLIAGNALNARSAGAGVGAGGAAMPHMGGFDGARYSAPQADDAGAPAYADPYRAHIQREAEADDDADSLQTWGNVDERHDAAVQRGHGSATAPTPR